jgi:hypothetical protein
MKKQEIFKLYIKSGARMKIWMVSMENGITVV